MDKKEKNASAPKAEKPKKKEPTSNRDKISLIAGIALCAILVPILVLNCVLIVSEWVTGKPPAIAGYSPMIVETPSMDPLIKSGDIIIIDQNVEAKDIKVGDVICFFDPAQPGTKMTVTHRVVDFDSNGKAITVGDNNAKNAYNYDLEAAKDDSAKLEEINNKIKTETDKNVPEGAEGGKYFIYGDPEKKDYEGADSTHVDLEENLVGIYTYKRAAGLGKIPMFIQQPYGWAICVGVPLVALIAWEIISRRKNKKATNKDMDALLAELEALKAAKAAAEGKDNPESAPESNSATDENNAPKSE